MSEQNGSEPRRFDAVLHTRVEGLKRAGIKTDLGPQFGNLVVRLRTFSHPAVVARQEALEKVAKAKEGTRDGEALPADKQLECNKKAVLMAVTGITEGEVLPTGEMLEVARRHQFKTQDTEQGTVVQFTGEEGAEACREFLDALGRASDSLPLRLINASRQLQGVKDQEIDRLGEAFVLGRHVEVDWHD